MAPEIMSSDGAGAKNDRKSLYSEEAERGVLGSVLLDAPKVLDFCIEKQLGTESFYLRFHQLIYEVLLKMSEDGRPVDVLTVAERLKALGKLEEIGGTVFLDRLIDSTPTAAHAEYYIDIVRQKQLLRRIVEKAREAEHLCYTSNDDAQAILDRVEQDFFDIAETRKGNLSPWSKILTDTMVTIEHILETKKGISGIPTGFVDLDNTLLGLHRGEMIILAARPSMGKTSLAMNIAENVALGQIDHTPRPVGIFSLEMTCEQIVRRMLCCHARVPYHRIAQGYLSTTHHGLLVQAANMLRQAPIHLDDSAGLDILDLRARARRMKQKQNIELFVIDYLQMLHVKDLTRRESRQVEIATISGSLKAMAKELNVPVLVLSQLNRAPEARDRSGKPRLADLRDSGSIEQDADVVCLLRRPSKYDDDDGKNQDPSLAIIDVAKQRNGPTGIINLTFEEEIMRFENRASDRGLEEGQGAGEGGE